MPTWTIEKSEKEYSLLDFLRLKIPLAPSAYLRQLIRRGKTRVNNIQVEPDRCLLTGDIVSLTDSRRIIAFMEQKEKQPTILFETAEILIVLKPTGLATHSSKGHETANLTDLVQTMLRDRGDKFKTAPIHRLDLPTSGPVIFGKGQKAISELGKLMQENKFCKKYLALATAGLPQSGILSGNIRSKGKVKQAETSFHTIEQQGALALLELELQTGRQHQIRKQLAEAGHPVAGDRRYRGLQPPGLDRLFLHCHVIVFPDPFSGRSITVNVPLPETLCTFLTSNNFAFSCKSATAQKNVLTA